VSGLPEDVPDGEADEEAPLQLPSGRRAALPEPKQTRDFHSGNRSTIGIEANDELVKKNCSYKKVQSYKIVF
jgi:hypothetical protein